MQTITYSKLRKNLAGLLEQVARDGQLVIISQGRGKPAAVLEPFEDFVS